MSLPEGFQPPVFKVDMFTDAPSTINMAAGNAYIPGLSWLGVARPTPDIPDFLFAPIERKNGVRFQNHIKIPEDKGMVFELNVAGVNDEHIDQLLSMQHDMEVLLNPWQNPEEASRLLYIVKEAVNGRQAKNF